MLPRTHGVRLALALTLALAAAGLCSIQAATAMPTLRISYVRALHLVPNGPLCSQGPTLGIACGVSRVISGVKRTAPIPAC